MPMTVTQPPNPQHHARVWICPNCLMTQAKPRQLSSDGDIWVCQTVGGCSGRFTDGYLRSTHTATERIMVALGFTKSSAITKGSVAEDNEQVFRTGHRNVRLPDEGPGDE